MHNKKEIISRKKNYLVLKSNFVNYSCVYKPPSELKSQTILEAELINCKNRDNFNSAFDNSGLVGKVAPLRTTLKSSANMQDNVKEIVTTSQKLSILGLK